MAKIHEAVAARYQVRETALGRQIIYMLAFNVLLILSAYIQFPLPFSPVPVTAQTMAVLACGLFLGPVRGALTVLAYIIEGSSGLPVFAGGSAGLARLLGPTGGYLIGFVPAAFLVGFLSEKMGSMTYRQLLLVLTGGAVIVYACGLIILALYAPKGSLLAMGLYPFLPGAAVKIFALASFLAAYKRIRSLL